MQRYWLKESARALRVPAAVVALWACVFTGCRSACTECEKSPCGAIPQPLGTYACQWQSAQASKAEWDDFVVYQYEWVDDSNQLSPFGRKHVMKLASRLVESPAWVRLEPSGDPVTDQSRQRALADALAEAGMADAFERVTIGSGTAEPLFGVEAPVVGQGFLTTGSRGNSGGSGGASAAGRASGIGNSGGLF